MVTMSKKPQTRKQAEDYLTKENYYQKDSEKGYIYSSSKELLNILNLTQRQEVNSEIHRNLINNRNPFDNNIKVVKGRRDNENDRAGFDVSTNAPKSVSILAEYYKNTDIEKYNQLIEIQKLANQKMMEKLKDYVRARVTINGERKYIKADILYSSFLHDVTRPNLDDTIDPHIHSHNFIYNIVSFQDENGQTKVMSLNNEEIMNQKMFLGQTYRNELATLLKEAGYELELSNAKEGFFEVKGFSKEQLDNFSARSIQIEKEMEKIREKYPLANESKLKDLANAKTKLAKKEINREKLFKENFERMAKVGINQELIKKIESNTPVHFDRDEIREHLKKAYKSITAHQSTFSIEELVRETLKQNVHLGVNEDYLTDLIIEDKEIVKFSLAENVYSTQTMIEAELYVVKNLQNESFKIDKNLNKIQKEIKKQGYELTKGQKGALDLIVQTDKQFIAIQGDAGSGKTFSMKILHDTYKNKYDFIGLAPTGQAADTLQNDSGINSLTIAKYLIKPPEKTDKQRVIVIDESGMIDSPSMAALMKSANENGDKVVFIGDTKQLQAVGAGKIFADMQKYGILIASVTENRRQKTDELRETVQAIKEKNIDKAISKLDIQDFSDYENQEIGQNKSINAIVKDFNKGDLVIAGTNKERDLLNIRLREKLGQHNKNEVLLSNLKNINLGGVDKYHSSTFRPGDIIQKGKSKYIVQSIKDDKTIVVKSARQDKEIIKELDIYSVENEYQLFRESKIKLAVGEEIIFTKNFEDNKKGISFKNGTTATIKKVDEKGNLVVITEAGRTLKFNIKDAPFLDYAYCLTDYKSQGLSKRVVRVLTSANNNLNSFYVQITRAMFQCTVYTSNKLDFIAKIKKEQLKTTTLDHLGYDPLTGEIFEKELEVKNEEILDGWVIRTGGYEALEEHEKESAQASYEVWKEKRLADNQYVFPLSSYVEYVQKINQKKREKKNEKESIKFKESNSESGDERQTALHESTHRDNRERIIAKSRDYMSILSKIPMVFNRDRTEMLLSTNDVNQLEQNSRRAANNQVRWANDSDNAITKSRGVENGPGTNIKNDIKTTRAASRESIEAAKTNAEFNTNFGNSIKSIGRGIRRVRKLIRRNFRGNFRAIRENREEVIKNLNELKRELKVQNVRDFKEYKTKLNTQNLVSFLISQGKEVTGHNPYFDPKKGEYRITVNGTRNLNAVDYLIKTHDYSFKEATDILESVYIEQLKMKVSEEVEVKVSPAVKELKTSLMDIINNAKKEDLRYFAHSQGYILNKDKSSANWILMKNEETGDKIIISEKNGIYMYYNPEIDNDKGTIYDFYQNRGVSKLSDMVQLIKGTDRNIELGKVSTSKNKIIDPDKLREKYNNLKSIFQTSNQYLKNRAISEDLLKCYSTIKIDERNNVVTPMYQINEKGTDFNFSGYNKKLANPITKTKDGELRNKPLKDLNEGNKGITILMSDNFEIKEKESHKNIVVAESFIDALSYLQLKNLDPKNTMLISTNGQQSEAMIKSIKSLLDRYPNNKTILAYDNDKKGDKFAEQTKHFIPGAIRDKSISKDWNEDLKSSKDAYKNVKNLINEENQSKNKGKELTQ